jgi:hypothetical protein
MGVHDPTSDIPAVPSPGPRREWSPPRARRFGSFTELTRAPKTLGTTDSVFYDNIGLVPGDPFS